jgi:hypothetical protein
VLKIRCPKCRAVGSDTDCTDQLHVDMNPEDEYELEVTMTFAVPVTSTLPMDPHEMATHMRDTWSTDDDALKRVLEDAADGVNGDIDLQVKPVFLG